MIGGGEGAFIGDVHRLAARLDGEFELICGVFSRDPQNSSRTGAALGMDSARIYPDYEVMMAKEALLPAGQRMDFVSIVTPNHLHFPVAKAAFENGFHVLSDKPATKDLAEVLELQELAKKHKRLYGLTHSYLGYPLIHYIRGLIANGELGDIRKVYVEYIQGWLSGNADNKQAEWRTDPQQSGKSGCMADIGTHAHNLAEFVTGKRMTQLAADLTTFGAGRLLDDDGSVLFRMEGGIKGTLSASQICTGAENGLSLRVYGTVGGISWHHERPNECARSYLDRPKEIITAGQGYLPNDIQEMWRLPAGHPEGYIEAFANLYCEFGQAIRDGSPISASVQSAVRGMAFIEAALDSAQNNSAWTDIIGQI